MLIGIDWGRKAHKIVSLKNSGELREIFEIGNDYEGYLDLLKHLHVSEEVVFAIEKRTHRLIDFLIAHGFSGYYVEPNAMKGYRSRYKSTSVKSDELDAFILADLLRTERHKLSVINLDTSFVRELKGLIIDRERSVRDEVRLVNRLKGCLVEYYPEALEFFGSPAGKVALAFWEAYPTLNDARQLTIGDIKNFLTQHKWYRDQDRVAERIVKIVKGKTIKVLEDVVRVKSRMLLGIVKQLKVVKELIAEYDAEIKRLMESSDNAGQYTSLPGAGLVLGTAIYTLFASGMQFNSLMDIRAYVGTAPVTSQSGQFKGIGFRYGCNRFYRNIFHQFAFCSLRKSQWAREYYRRKRREGKKHHHALRCLADLWVKVIYAMWHNKELYNEQKHLASIARFWIHNDSHKKD
jgi:transposase